MKSIATLLRLIFFVTMSPRAFSELDNVLMVVQLGWSCSVSLQLRTGEVLSPPEASFVPCGPAVRTQSSL